MSSNTCALPGCDNQLEGLAQPFRLGSHPGFYCSRDCVNEAFVLKQSGKPFIKSIGKESVSKSTASKAKEMKVPAPEFGDAGLYRTYCDNPKCRKPVTLQWDGRHGVYCSKPCLDTEKEPNFMTAEEVEDMEDEEVEDEDEQEDEEEEEEEDDSPVKKSNKKSSPPAKKKSAPAPVSKKSAQKPAAPAAKKAAAPAASSNGNSNRRYTDDQTYVVKKTDYEVKGKRGEALKLMLKTSSVGKFRAALTKKEDDGLKDFKSYLGWALSFGVDNGLIAFKR